MFIFPLYCVLRLQYTRRTCLFCCTSFYNADKEYKTVTVDFSQLRVSNGNQIYPTPIWIKERIFYMVHKEFLGTTMLFVLAILFILVDKYLPSIARMLNFVVFWLCVLVLLYHLIFLIRAKLKSRKQSKEIFPALFF